VQDSGGRRACVAQSAELLRFESQCVRVLTRTDRWLTRSRQPRMPCSRLMRHGSSQHRCCAGLVCLTINHLSDGTHKACCGMLAERIRSQPGAAPCESVPCISGLPSEWSDLAAWLWASATVSSRTMFVPFDPAGVLTPFGDLCNFVSPPPRVPPPMPGGAFPLSMDWLCMHCNNPLEHCTVAVLGACARRHGTVPNSAVLPRRCIRGCCRSSR